MNPNCILLYGDDQYTIKKQTDLILKSSGIFIQDIEIYDYEEDGLESAIQSAMTLPFWQNKKQLFLKTVFFWLTKKYIYRRI